MTPLLSLLLNGLPPGLWQLDRFGSVQRRLVEAFGHGIAAIDIDPRSPKSELLDLVADRLGLPQWFGGNWDALYDSLLDLPRRVDPRSPGGSSTTGDRTDLIVIRAAHRPDADPVRDTRPGADTAVLLGIFSEVADEARRCVVVAGIEVGSVSTTG